jgi:hypothetical protein
MLEDIESMQQRDQEQWRGFVRDELATLRTLSTTAPKALLIALVGVECLHERT